MSDSTATANRNLICPTIGLRRHNVLRFQRLFEVAFVIGWSLCWHTASEAALVSDINSWIPKTGLNLTLDSSVFLSKATAANLNSVRSNVVNSWVMPNGVTTGSNALVTDLASIGSMGLSSSEVQPYLDLISTGQFALLEGHDIFQLNWTINNSGLGGSRTFSTLGYENGLGDSVFEPWLYQTPIQGSPYIWTTNYGDSVKFRTYNYFGNTTSGDAAITITCSDPIQCDVVTSSSSTPLWESEITHEPEKLFTMNGLTCCSSIIHYGFANGFKDIKIGTDKFTLELTGNFGWGGTDEAKIIACCPEPSSFLLFGLVLPIVGYRARRQRSSRVLTSDVRI